MSQIQLTYVLVQAGDTLATIAARYKTTVATIARLNRLSKDAELRPGALLQVPKPPPEPAMKSKQLVRPPRAPRYAFAVHTGQEGVYPGSNKGLVREGQEGLSGIFPLWFQPSPVEPWRLQSFVTDEAIQETMRTASERQVKVLAKLTNLYYRGVVSGKEIAHQAMTMHGDELLANVMHTCRHYKLDGIVLDWIDLYEEDHEEFAHWVLKLGRACREFDMKLVVNIALQPGKDGAPDSGSFDLRRIGEAADWVALLLNTEHRMYTSPGPLSSFNWAESGIRHALEQGVPARKILLGIAGYAYDWKGSSQVPEYLSFEGAMNRARQYRVNVQFDAKSQTPMYRYQDSSGAEHQVWFENTSSLSQKITLVNRYDLAGISLWRLGIEDPGLWPLLRSRWGGIKKGDTRFHNIYYDK